MEEREYYVIVEWQIQGISQDPTLDYSNKDIYTTHTLILYSFSL